MEAGAPDAAYASLRQVLDLAKKADAWQGRAFTAPVFDLLENNNPDSLPDRVERWLLSYVENNTLIGRRTQPLPRS